MKKNAKRLSVILIVLVFISAIQLSAFAKPNANKDNEKKNVQATDTLTSSVKEADKAAKDKEDKKDKKVTPAKEIKKAEPSKIDIKLTSIEKKVNSVVNAVYGIEKVIDTYIKVTVLPATASPTPAPTPTATPTATATPAPTTTPAPIPTVAPSPAASTAPSPTPAATGNTAKVPNIKGFVNGTTGKLNALTNELKVVDKELSLLSKDPEIIKNEKYKILVNKVNMIKGSIKAQLDRLKKISAVKK